VTRPEALRVARPALASLARCARIAFAHAPCRATLRAVTALAPRGLSRPIRNLVHRLAGPVGRVGIPARAQLRSGGEVLV
jgi:hypothetical protein